MIGQAVGTVLALLLCCTGGLLVAAFLLLTAYIYYIRRKYSHIPSPPLPSFYLGHALDVVRECKRTGNRELPTHELVNMWSSKANDAKCFVLFFVWDVLVILLDPDDIKKVTMQHRHGRSVTYFKHLQRVMGERFLGHSLISITDYETWKPRKKLYDPTFTKRFVKTLIPEFNKCVDTFINNLKPFADGNTTTYINEHLDDFTLDVVSRVVFSTDLAKVWTSKSRELKKVKGTGKQRFILDHSLQGAQRVLRYPLKSLFRYFHPLETEGYWETIRALRDIGRDCILKRIEVIEKGQQPPNDTLTHILEIAKNEKAVDLEILVDDFLAFYTAGQDTTVSLFTFIVIMLHFNPDVVQRVVEEVDEVLGDSEVVSAEKLDQLQYTEQVILETLRLYPVGSGLSRDVGKGGITLQGFNIPEGTPVMVFAPPLHKSSKYFDDPDVFNPSRFEQQNQRPSPYVYFPFGLGHRACIGRHFAMVEAKILIARMVQTFTVTLPRDYKLTVIGRLVDQPKGNVPCTVRFRDVDSH